MLACEEMNYIDSNARIDAAVSKVAAVRDVVGFDLGIGIDFHGRVHRPMVKTLARQLEPLRPMFYEEPLLSEHADALLDLAHSTTVPLALGERLFTRWEFKKIFEGGAIALIQPDASHAGGITETKKIAAMAESYDIGLALHCPLGPIALAACLQLDGLCQNAVIQEQSLGIHYNKTNDLLDYLVDPQVFKFTDGYVDIPDRPGLGIEINEEYVRQRAKIGLGARRELWKHPDGSFAEW
jgi:galactonate dehydratase